MERAYLDSSVSDAEAVLRRHYRRLINIAGTYYYVSIPFVIFLVLAVAGSIVYGFLVLRHPQPERQENTSRQGLRSLRSRARASAARRARRASISVSRGLILKGTEFIGTNLLPSLQSIVMFAGPTLECAS